MPLNNKKNNNKQTNKPSNRFDNLQLLKRKCFFYKIEKTQNSGTNNKPDIVEQNNSREKMKTHYKS